MSDIVKNSVFLFEGKGLMNTSQMFCSLFLLGNIQYIVVLSPKKLANVREVLDWVFELWCAWMDDGSDKIVFG